MSKARVLVGTKKGAFILTSDGARKNWEVSQPHFMGWEMYHLKGSPADQFWGDRHGGVQDACGNQWWMSTYIEDLTPKQIKERGRLDEESEEVSFPPIMKMTCERNHNCFPRHLVPCGAASR